MQVVIDLPTEVLSEQWAVRLAACVQAPMIITFNGEIGAGKTTIIRAMLRRLGVQSAIKSPTFSLIESYQLPQVVIHHFDLYRIHDETELEYIGFRDYFSSDAVCCVEWPERAPENLRHVDVAFSLVRKGSGRALSARAFSLAGINLLSCMKD